MSGAVDRAALTGGATMGEVILRATRRYTTRPAFVAAGRACTYGELSVLIARARAALAALGLAPGTVVAQLTGNRPEPFALQAAAYLAGHPSLMLHPKTSRADLIAIMRDSQARLLIVDADGPLATAEAIAEIRRECPELTQVAHGPGSALPDVWTTTADLDHRSAADVEPDSLARLAYTGGTTGRPKAVALTHRAMVAATGLAAAEMDWPERIRFLVATPISHAGGTLVPSVLLRGGTVHFTDRFEPTGFLDQIRREEITATFAVPTMITRLVESVRAAPDGPPPSLQMLLYGGAPMPPPAIEAALAAFGPVLVQSYGQAEAPNTIAVLTRDEHRPELLGSCGLPYSAVQVAILDDDGALVAQGEVGEVCVRGPQVMQGYLGHPELTAEALRGGWLHTGDVGYLAPSGHLFLVARQRDVIITGGFNVYPGDVEQVLMSHPGVRECVVVGVPDPTWGEAVTAVVVPARPVDAVELGNLVRAQKGPVYVPKRIEFADELPLTALGKPDRHAVRARLSPAGDPAVG
jgi:fatty-acyl-CoA synthase